MSSGLISPHPEAGHPRSGPDHAVVFTGVAVGTAFVLLLMPSDRHDFREVGVAAVLGVGLLVLALLWDRTPGLARIGVPFGYLAFVALLRDAAGGSDSGFGGLLLLPVLWLALTAGGRELAAALVAMSLAQLIPLVAVGPPWYPTEGWRAAVVLTSAALITGLMVQRLVGQTRARALLLERQASDLELASKRLLDQNERLLRLDRLKDEFIALVSHELRTPLTSISGYLEMALDADDDASRQSYLSTMQRNVVRLRSLVNDLLFLAWSDSHGIELERGPVDLQAVLEEAVESARPVARDQGVEISLRTEVLPDVLADRTRLLQLVDNLLGNAVKFSHRGGRVELAGRRHGDGVLLSVSDEGVGIAADELPHLFERFYRGSKATDRAVAGTGLGLSIARLIAEAHDTSIEVDSSEEGTTFRVALPGVPAAGGRHRARSGSQRGSSGGADVLARPTG